MNFEDWSPKAVENRIIKAMETHKHLPYVAGPREFGNAMPDIVREKWKDAAPDKTRYMRRLAPGAISRMEQCWEWINSYVGEDDRKFIDHWAYMKVTKGRKIDEMSEKNPSLAKSINRRKTRICSTIANNLNQKHHVRLNNGDCDLSENQPVIAPTTVSSEKRVTNWLPSDAKPQIDPALASMRVLDNRAIRARHSDRNRSLGAK